MLRRQFRSACEDFRERRLLYRTCEQLTRIALSLRDRLWRNESQRFHLIGVGLSNLSEAKQPNAPHFITIMQHRRSWFTYLALARGGLLVAENWDVHGSASGQSLQLEPRTTLAH